MKLFIVPNTGYNCVFNLVTEDGEALASHLCSHEGYAKSDLEAGRPERQKEWKERFGEYEVMFLNEQTEITKKELLKRNKAWYKNLPKEKN